MTYDKLQLLTRGVLPLLSFVFAAFLTLLLLLSTHVDLWILFLGSLGMGICGVIIVSGLTTPCNNFFLTRELKEGNTNERLAAWHTETPKREIYIGPNGVWDDGKKYYWGHSLFLSLEDICLHQTSSGMELIVKLGETFGRSTRYFSLEIPVPFGQESEAETVVRGILADNIILDEKKNRKQIVTYI